MELFVRRRTNRKKGEPGIRALDVGLVAAAVLVSASAFYLERDAVARAANRLSGSLVDQPYFAVREITVRGGKKVGGSEIVAMAGLSHGMSIWKVDPEGIERKVGKHPWVKRVLVRRELPGRVVIEVTERTVRAIVLVGNPYYVDGDGILFKEVSQGEKMDFPLLTGLTREDFASRAPATRQKIQDILRIGELLAERSLALSEIRFDAQGEVILYPMAFPVALHMGWGGWEEKVERLEQVLGLWRGKEDRLAVLDFNYQDQVVARVKKNQG